MMDGLVELGCFDEMLVDGKMMGISRLDLYEAAAWASVSRRKEASTDL